MYLYGRSPSDYNEVFVCEIYSLVKISTIVKRFWEVPELHGMFVNFPLWVSYWCVLYDLIIDADFGIIE